MPDIFYLNDHGSVIFNDSDQLVYTKVGTRNDVQPSEAWDPADKGSIAGFSYNASRADAQGRYTYSAEEMAVAENLYYKETIAPVANQWYTWWNSLPVSGVLRLGCNNTGSYDNTRLRVNGITVQTGIGNMGTTVRSNDMNGVYNVAAGSLVEVMDTTGQGGGGYPTLYIKGILIPFVYP